MAENLAFQLRRGHKLTGCVAIKIRYSDFQTYTQQQKITYSAADHNIIPIVTQLYEKLYQRRMLVRLIGIRLSDLVSGGHQIDLFDDAEKTIKLYQAMDLMRERYGDRAVIRAVSMDAKTIGRYNPFSGEPPPLLANRRQ
jgi:DNA polymerase IV